MKKFLVTGLCGVLVAGLAHADKYSDLVAQGDLTQKEAQGLRAVSQPVDLDQLQLALPMVETERAMPTKVERERAYASGTAADLSMRATQAELSEAAQRKLRHEAVGAPRTTDCNNPTALASGTHTIAAGETWFFSYTGTGVGLDLQTCNAGTDFDTDMYIYDNCTDLTQLYYRDGDSACGYATYLECDEFTFEDGVDYLIGITGYSGAGGTFELTVGAPCDPPPPPPANDDFANAIDITVDGDCMSGSTDQATQDAVPPFTQDACWTGFYSATSTGNAPDVWYRFMADGVTSYTISLCSAPDYDSALGIFDAAGVSIGGNDDSCGLTSEVSCVYPAGMVYIAVDGYSTNTGAYELCVTTTAPPCEDLGCPTGFDFAELEAPCDDTNGGCNSDPVAAEPWSGLATCGTTWADGGSRDTDWFLFTVPEPGGIVDLTVASVCVPMAGVIFDLDCEAPTEFAAVFAAEGTTAMGSTECLAPGDYYMLAVAYDELSGNLFEGYPCTVETPWHYGLDLAITECAFVDPCDVFAPVAVDPFAGVSLVGENTVGAPDVLELGNGQLGYTFTAADWFTLDVTTCLAGTAFDTDSYLFAGDPCDGGLNVLYNDGSCELTDFATNFLTTCIPPGDYTLVIGGFGAGDEGLFDINMNATICGCDEIMCDGVAEVEPNEDFSTATLMSCGMTACGTVTTTWDGVENTFDLDYFSVTLDDTYIIDASLSVEGIDGVLSLVDSDGTTILTQGDLGGWCEGESLTSECLLPGTYYLVVAAAGYWADTTGDYALSVTCTPCEIIDPCDPVAEMTLPTFSDTGSTLNTTNVAGNAANDYIYTFVAPVDCDVTVSLCGGGTDYDSYLRAYETVSPCDGGTEFALNDDFCGLQSELTFSVTAGLTYWVLVEGFSANNGNFQIDVTSTCVSPCEDIVDLVALYGGGNITLSWSAVAAATSYNLVVADGGDFGGATVTPLGNVTSTVIPASLGNYHIRVEPVCP